MDALGMDRERRALRAADPPRLQVPWSRQCCISLTTKLMLTSNLAAAARRDIAASTTRTTRSRRSTDKLVPFIGGLRHPAASLNHNNRTL
jgi:hypothetical protein